MTHEWVRRCRRAAAAARRGFVRLVPCWTPGNIAYQMAMILIVVQGVSCVLDDREASRSNLVFEDKGTIYQQVETAHLHTVVDLDNAVGRYNQLVAHIRESWSEATEDKRADDAAMYVEIMGELAETEKALRFTCGLVECGTAPIRANFNDTLERPERSLLAILSGGLSIYNYVSIERLRAMVRSNAANVKVLYAAVQENRVMLDKHSAAIDYLSAVQSHEVKRLDQLTLEVRRNEVTTSVKGYATATSDWFNTFNIVLLEKRLPPQLFELGSLQIAYNELKEKVESKGLTLALPSVTSLAQAPLSFVGKKGIVDIFLHIPVVRPEPFQLYRLLPLPIRANDGRLVDIIESRPYLALNRRQTEAIDLTEQEFSECSLLSGHRVCGATMIRKDQRGSCTGALFHGSSHALSVCTLLPHKGDREVITQVGEQDVVVIPPAHERIEVNMNCRKPGGGYSTKDWRVTTVRRFHLKKGCTISTPRYSFSPVNEFSFEPQFVTRVAPELGGDVIEKLDAYNRTRAILEGHHPITFDFQNMTHLKELTKPHPTHTTLQVIAILIGFALIVGLAFLCALLLWLEWKRRQGVDAVQAVESVAQVAYKKGAEGVHIRGANFTSPGLMERAGDAVARLSSAGSAASFPSEAREKAF